MIVKDTRDDRDDNVLTRVFCTIHERIIAGWSFGIQFLDRTAKGKSK